jgi:hypothetical protein
MFDCFQDQPDYTPYTAIPANIPLDQLNPRPTAIQDDTLRQDAIVSASLNFREIDRAPEDVLNRILWRAMRGTHVPYPEWAITSHVEDDEEEEEEAAKHEAAGKKAAEEAIKTRSRSIERASQQ